MAAERDLTPSQVWAQLQRAARHLAREWGDHGKLLDAEAIAQAVIEDNLRYPDVRWFEALLVDDVREFVRWLRAE